MCCYRYAQPVASLLPFASDHFISYSTTKVESHPCILDESQVEVEGEATIGTREKSHTFCSFHIDAIFFRFWIKFAFICIIKTFSYIKYQTFFCYLTFIHTRTWIMIRSWYRIVYTQDRDLAILGWWWFTSTATLHYALLMKNMFFNKLLSSYYDNERGDVLCYAKRWQQSSL
jgi:hypothetical protein